MDTTMSAQPDSPQTGNPVSISIPAADWTAIKDQLEQQKETILQQTKKIEALTLAAQYSTTNPTPSFTPAARTVPPTTTPLVPPTTPTDALPQATHQLLRKKKMRLPDPPKFSGKRSEFRIWKIEMNNKLATDGDAIGGNVDQFRYIFSRLDTEPQGMVAAFAEVGGNGYQYDPQDFMRYLETCKGDPNAAQRALERLGVLRQRGDESFGTFLLKFERESPMPGDRDGLTESKSTT